MPVEIPLPPGADAVNDKAMIDMLDTRKAIPYLKKYIARLSKNGYVKSWAVKRYMRYLFLVDFVETFYPLVTESDYGMIDDVMLMLFSEHDCLLTYPVFRSSCKKMVLPWDTSDDALRVTCLNRALRYTENGQLRKA